MKKHLLLLVLSVFAATSFAAPQNEGPKTEVSGHKKYQIAVNALQRNDSESIKFLDALDNVNKANRGLFGNTVFGTFIQKTTTFSTNLISLGIDAISELFKKQTEKKNFKSWHDAVMKMNSFRYVITSKDEQIDDFYSERSNNGALDPSNIRFDGFVFRNYEEEDKKENADSTKPQKPNHMMGSKGAGKPDFMKKNARGNDICYIKCSLRKDTLGITHILNHSRFYLQVDSILFCPDRCSVPNDSTSMTAEGMNLNSAKANKKFFTTRNDLRVNLNVKVYSSWVNEAIMYTTDYKMGEFNISFKVDKRDLVLKDKDSVFYYSREERLSTDSAIKKKYAHLDSLVTISGDCFVVPRSFIGSSTNPLWGTGQYRLDMEFSEACSLNENYYCELDTATDKTNKDPKDKGKVKKLHQKKWKKDIWYAEWQEMKKNRRDITTPWQSIKRTVTTAYIGDNWVKEIVDPFSTILIQEETTTLNNIFDMQAVQSAGSGVAVQQQVNMQPVATQQPQMPH